MADPNIAEVTPQPLVIDIGRKPSFAPDLPSEGAPAAPPREFGRDAGVNPSANESGTFGDKYTREAQLQQGRAAREMLDRLGSEGVPKAAVSAAGSALAASSAPPEGEPSPSGSKGGGFAESVGSVIKDVGRGISQSPRAAAQGAGEAVRQVAKASDSLATWLNENVADLTFAIPKTGSETVDSFLANPAASIAGAVPKMGDKPDTVTGGLVHDVAQFLTGMAIGGKLMEGAGITLTGFGKVASTGAFSDFAARDPDAKKLSDLMEQHPALRNPVTGLLTAKEGDNEGMKRLKAALEGAGLGAMTEGFMRGVKLVHARWKAGQAVSEQGKLLDTIEKEAEARYGRLSEDSRLALGDPDAPLVQAAPRVDKGKKAARKIDAADQPIDGLSANDLVGKGTPPVPPGKVRVFHGGGVDPKTLDELHVTPSIHDADGWASRGEGMRVWYADVPKDSPWLKLVDEFSPEYGYTRSIAPKNVLDQFKPYEAPKTGLTKTTDAGGNEIYVNFGRIDTPDDVKQVIGLMADAGKDRINLARGGEKQTFAKMEALAADLNMDVTDLLARRTGQPMSAAEALASRSLLAASAEKLTSLAQRIAAGGASPAEEFAFRRQMAVHAAIQTEVIAARTETARALASWNIPRGGGIEASKAVSETLEAMGGSATTQELARRLDMLSRARDGNIGAISDFARKSVTARTIDAAMEAWKSSMLSGPTTHLANMGSNLLTASIAIPERYLGGKISQLRGTPDGVALGEANALAHGLVTSSREALQMAWMALKTGEGSFGRASGKADLTPTRAISREALGLPDNVWGNAVDYIGKGFNIPFRFLTAEDEFFKTMAFRAELHAQAQRVAQNEGLVGAAASARAKQIVDNPPEVVKLAATDFALASTYNRELTGAMAALARARGQDDVVGRGMQFVLPFFRTPVNVFSASVERSPLAFLTSQFRADVAAGGARQDLALARMAAGTTIMLVAADLADQGMITGMISKDPGKKEAYDRQGVPPYSVKIGDKWYAYNRADPVAMPMAIAANIAELARRFEIEPDKLDSMSEIVAAGIGGTAKAALDRSFMQGTAGLISAIADPEQHADGYMKNTLAGFFTPAIGNMAAQLADPVRRETFNAIEAIEARIVELSKTLIPRMDLWGREVRLAESGVGHTFDVLSPVKVQSEKPNPIDAELIRLNYFPKRIDKKGSWDGAPTEFAKFPEVYAEYAQLAGNGYKSPIYDGKGAMDFLNAVVQGKSQYSALYNLYSDGPEGGKAQWIQKVVSDYRQAARRQIEADPRFAEFRQYLAAQTVDANVKRAPTDEQRQVAPMIPMTR